MKDHTITECTASVLVDPEAKLNQSTILDWTFPLGNTGTSYDEASREWTLVLRFAVKVSDPSRRLVCITGMADCTVRIPQDTIPKGADAWMPTMLHEALHRCSKAVQEDIKPIEVTGHMPWPIETDSPFFGFFRAHYNGPLLFGKKVAVKNIPPIDSDTERSPQVPSASYDTGAAK